MNIQEFSELKPGDEIENLMAQSRGRISEIKPNGVMVSWGGNTIISFFYSVQGTAWFHWSKIEHEN